MTALGRKAANIEAPLEVLRLATSRLSELFFSLHGGIDRGVLAMLFNEKVGGALDIDVGSHV